MVCEVVGRSFGKPGTGTNAARDQCLIIQLNLKTPTLILQGNFDVIVALVPAEEILQVFPDGLLGIAENVFDFWLGPLCSG